MDTLLLQYLDLKMNNKTILVTGGNGFIGQALCARLAENGYIVYSLSRDNNKSYSSNIKTVYGDVTDWNFVNHLIKEKRITTIFHLASKALVDQGSLNPRETFKTNIEGTWNILEAARHSNIERVIIASSAHVYGNNEQVPYKEYFPPRPSRIYETSKACADIISQSYYSTYNLPVFIARFTNIFGPGDTNFSRLIPKTIQSLLSYSDPRIWGGDVIRDYLYIDDAINAYSLLLQINPGKTKNHIFNFGSGQIISVFDLVQKIINLSDYKNARIVHVQGKRKDEVLRQYLSTNKAKRLLGWKSQYTLDGGLRNTIRWYKENL